MLLLVSILGSTLVPLHLQINSCPFVKTEVSDKRKTTFGFSSQDSRRTFGGFHTTHVPLWPKPRCSATTVQRDNSVQQSSDPRQKEEQLKMTSQDPPANLMKADLEYGKYVMALKHDNPWYGRFFT